MHAYCVVLRAQHSLNVLYPRTKRCYLIARSAALAMLIASEDPQWLVVGVEPARLSASAPQSERAVSSESSIVAWVVQPGISRGKGGTFAAISLAG